MVTKVTHEKLPRPNINTQGGAIVPACEDKLARLIAVFLIVVGNISLVWSGLQVPDIPNFLTNASSNRNHSLLRVERAAILVDVLNGAL